jgi:hypothetical protein
MLADRTRPGSTAANRYEDSEEGDVEMGRTDPLPQKPNSPRQLVGVRQ